MLLRKCVCHQHRRRSWVNFRGTRHFGRENMYEKLTKCQKFTWFLPEKLSIYENFYNICPKKNKLNCRILHDFRPKTPEFYIIIARKKFFPRFFVGGGARPPCSLSPTPMFVSWRLSLCISGFWRWSLKPQRRCLRRGLPTSVYQSETFCSQPTSKPWLRYTDRTCVTSSRSRPTNNKCLCRAPSPSIMRVHQHYWLNVNFSVRETSLIWLTVLVAYTLKFRRRWTSAGNSTVFVTPTEQWHIILRDSTVESRRVGVGGVNRIRD